MSEGAFPPSFGSSLEDCNREPIHVPGAIQPHGMLLAMNPADLHVLQVSANVPDFLQIEVRQLLHNSIGALFERDIWLQLEPCLSAAEAPTFNPLRLPLKIGGITTYFDGVIHQSEGALILELENPTPAAAASGPLIRVVDPYFDLIARVASKAADCSTIEQVSEVLAREVRAFTGFDRVMVYRFAPDFHGEVIAERAADGLEPYLGLHYPASDIPEQARRLYALNWLRLIVDVDYVPAPLVPQVNPLTNRPLDMSHSVLRSVSPIHLQYLRNMGVASSMSISLLRDEQLWGLIACHHRTPKFIPYSTRAACVMLGAVISGKLFTKEQEILKSRRSRAQEKLVGMLRKMAGEQRVEEAVLSKAQVLFDVFNATGLAIQFNSRIHLAGETPSASQVSQLLQAVDERSEDAVFAADCLSEILPSISANGSPAAGVLVIRFSTDAALALFRPEYITTVRWAGDPRKPVSGDAGQPLSPRSSFVAWSEEIRGRSLPWHDVDLELAAELGVSTTAFVIRRLRDLEELNQQLRNSQAAAEQANRAKSDFLANMSHEVRTPLSAVLGLTELLLQQESSDEKLKMLQMMRDNGAYLIELLNDILDLSKVEAGKLQMDSVACSPIQLIQQVESLMHVRAAEKNLELICEFHGEIPETIHTDPVRLRQVLVNLVGNAVKFTNRGSVRIVTDLQGEGAQAKMRIQVIDSGVGISRQMQQSIFEPFEQGNLALVRHVGGTGLGLAISKHLAGLLGGELLCSSELGKGSVFTLTFDPHLADDAALVDSTGAGSSAQSAHDDQPPRLDLDCRVLVAEDAPGLRFLIRKMLESAGANVEVAENGSQALQAIKRADDASTPFDIVVMDMRMPVMDGYQAVSALRATGFDRPIIALTASAMKEDREKCVRLGCNAYLTKPVDQNELLSDVARLVPR